MSRDCGGGNGEAAAKALPHAVQVVERWHVMENAGAAILGVVRTLVRPIPTVLLHLARCDVPLVEGSVERRGATGTLLSVYIRDLDANLVEIASLTPLNSAVRDAERRCGTSQDREGDRA